VFIGNHFRCGDNVLIRENTAIGNFVTIKDRCFVDADSSIADKTTIEPEVYLPRSTTLGEGVYIGPNVRFLHDYPFLKSRAEQKQGVILEDGCTIGANAILHPGICVGEGAHVADGTVVHDHVPPHVYVSGSPMKFRRLDE
jgi:acetyltransferase-like isoleucine patch superfamily enzyme